tara:strand:+ start:6814 stop:7281 length:468 start_codon:yes stop_codon:yes gene_type:complete
MGRSKKERAEPVDSAAAADGVKSGGSSTQDKAGLSFPVRRTETRLRFKTRSTITRVSGLTSVYVTGLAQHVAAHVLMLAGEEAARVSQKRISPAHVQQAVRSCPDLARTFAGFSFATTLDVPKASKMILTKTKIKEQAAKVEEKKAMIAQAKAAA